MNFATYLDLGMAVLPLYGVRDGKCLCPAGDKCTFSPGKHPDASIVPNGVKNASKDSAIVNQWSKQRTRANWAVRAGDPLVGGGFLAVLDVDPRNGGDETLETLPDLPDTPTQETGGGGWHYLFRSKTQLSSRCVGPGLDFIAAGKYFVIDPSSHESGGTYSWAMGKGLEDLPIADLPDWLADSTGSTTVRPEAEGTAIDTVMGEVFRLSGKLGVPMQGGLYAVECPWADEHSDSRGRGKDTSTVILPPAGGSRFGGFRCLHGHCQNRKYHDVLKKIPTEYVEAANRKFPMRPVVAKEQSPAAPIYDDDDPYAALKLRLNYTKKKTPVSDVVTLGTILKYDPRWTGLLKFDTFSQKVRFTRQPPWHPDDKGTDAGDRDTWSDADVRRMDLWLRRTWGVELDDTKIGSTVYVIAKANSYNPLQDYFAALTWDGTPRIDEWLIRYCGAEDTPYHRAVGAKFMISACARAMDPGCKVDTMMILEGMQGKGKSTALRGLCPKTEWFSDTPFDLHSKDAYVAIRGKFIIELAELASLRKAEMDRAKAFLSSSVDDYRPPYGRENVQVPRQCVFSGSDNRDSYLKDETGARRFWGVKTGVIDTTGLLEDKDQLWAEALHRYKAGEPWWASYDQEAMFEIEAVARTEEDPWETPIFRWLTSQIGQAFLQSHDGCIQNAEVATMILHLKDSDTDRGVQMRIGYCLCRLGFKRVRITVHGRRLWSYKK